jgi:hypothetical protein
MFFARSVVMVEREATVRSARADKGPNRRVVRSREKRGMVFIMIMITYY